MSNKNPFEIRLELLNMAKQYLEQQWHYSVEFSRQAYEKALELGKVTQEECTKYLPPMFSVDDVIKKAEELYGFVCKNGSSEPTAKVDKK